jgi:hypothetical protein
LSISVDAHGHLDVGSLSRTVRYGTVGTAVWLALRRHDGDVGAAAAMLAAQWGTEPANARADLDIWVEEMRCAGLLRTEP